MLNIIKSFDNTIIINAEEENSIYINFCLLPCKRTHFYQKQGLYLTFAHDISKFYLKSHSCAAKSCDNWENLSNFTTSSMPKCFHLWWLRGWVGLHTDISVFWTLWLWRSKNLARSNSLSKTKQRERPLGCLYTSPLTLLIEGAVRVVDLIYSSAWGFRRCSFRQTGQCESL